MKSRKKSLISFKITSAGALAFIGASVSMTAQATEGPHLSEVGRVIYVCSNESEILDLTYNDQSDNFFVIRSGKNGEIFKIDHAKNLNSDAEIYQVGEDSLFEVIGGALPVQGQLRSISSQEISGNFICNRNPIPLKT